MASLNVLSADDDDREAGTQRSISGTIAVSKLTLGS